MGPRVKICGIANAADAEAVAALRPDFLGFIFWPGSKRFVRAEDLAAWAKNLPPIPRVGVFVDATPDEVRHTVATAGLSAIQLHGHENADAYRGLAGQLWQVVKIAAGESGISNLKFEIQEPPPFVDAVLLDTYSPTSPGGTGETGDWATARSLVASMTKPVLLAGGLTASNVAQAIRLVQPWGVDVSSGVEERPGKKDLSKTRDFIHAARNH